MKFIIAFLPFLIAAGPKKVVENPTQYMPGTNVPIEEVNTTPNPTPDQYESSESDGAIQRMQAKKRLKGRGTKAPSAKKSSQEREKEQQDQLQ